MQRPSLSRTALLASQASEWLVLLLLLAASTPAVLIRHGSLTTVPALNLLDDSWLLDTSYKAAGGVWLGRDVAFTYGPLFQWLSSAPSQWLGASMGTILATRDTLLFCVVVLATFFSARLLLPETAGWRRAVLMFLAVVFWSPPDARVSLCLLAFAIFLRLCDGVLAGKRAVVTSAFAAAAVCVTMFLFSADSGIYAVAALVLCLAATLIARGRIARAGRFSLWMIVALGVLVLPTNAATKSPLNFQFWRSSLAIAGGYRWFQPIRMSKPDKHLLVAILAAGLAVFTFGWLLRKPRGPWTRRPAFILAGFGFAFVAMQTSLVRSDHGHVLIGSYAMVFLGGAILLDDFGGPRWPSAALPIGVIAATVVLVPAIPVFRPGSVSTLLRQVAHPVLSCAAGLQEFDRACFSPADALLLRSVSGFVDSHTAAGSPIAVFPYQTAFGLASRRQVAGGVLQDYLVNGGYLTQLEIAGLQKTDPPLALYFPDTPSSPSLDWVPSFTRSPDVWFYFFRHYGAIGVPATGVVGLARDDSRDSRMRFSSESIRESLTAVAINKRSTTIDLGQVRWPAEGSDFLKLRLRVDYPIWWGVRKPSCLTLLMSFADGSQKPIQFVLQPGRATDIWVYPWAEADMAEYFSADQAQWRTKNRPALTGLQLLVTPFDWISVVPNGVAVESIEAVQVDLQ